MESTQNRTPILIVGAMGHLGTHITRCALQEPTLLVSIMDRDLTKDKELVTMVKSKGGKTYEGDICDPTIMKECTKGMHTVISVICSDDEKIMVDGQMSLMKICVENGVQRFVPSDFSMNIDRFHPDEISGCPTLKSKMKFNELMTTTKTTPMVLRIETGMMMETLCDLMSRLGGPCIYGDHPNMKLDLTCCDDIAKLVVSAVSKKDTTGTLGLVGCTCTMDEIVDAYNKVRGTKLKAKKLGSLHDIKKKCEEMMKQGDMKGAETCTILSIMFDPRSKIEKTHNTMIPTVKTMTMEDFFKTHPEITME